MYPQFLVCLLKNAKINCLFILAFFIIADIGLSQPVQERIVTHSKRRPLEVDNSHALVTVTAVGDLMMSSWIIDIVKEKGVDYPFDSTRSLLQMGDIAMANLEAPLTDSGSPYPDKKYTFKVPPSFVQGIKRAGINVVTLANNHILDFGLDGLYDTMATLDSSGIAHCGAGRSRAEACDPVILELRGIKVAFLGFSMTFPKEFWAGPDSGGTCYPDEALLYSVVRKAEENADLTIASFHWGAEKSTAPKDYQTDLAHKAVDYGVDLVLGHHPHVLQGIEIYKNRLIAYSLGNYVFASYSNNARDSIVLKARLTSAGLMDGRVFPITVYNAEVEFQPRPLHGKEHARVIDHLNKISIDLNGYEILTPDGEIVKYKNPINSTPFPAQ